MDSHIKGPRAPTKATFRASLGAIVSAIIVGAKFGDPAINALEIFRTDGASSGLGPIAGIPHITTKKFPLLIEFQGHISTTFDGTAPVFTLTETNLDDTGSVVIANIASFTAGFFSAFKILTAADKKYKLTYTPATGAPTAGEGYFAIKATGPGENSIY